MSVNLRLELQHKHPDLLCVLADVRDAMKRIPERVFHPEFGFRVTAHHVTRVVAKLAGNVEPVDGQVTYGCGVGAWHSWLATRHNGYIIEVLPPDAVVKPYIVNIGENSVWSGCYDTFHVKALYPTFDSEVASLLDLITDVETYLSLP